METTGKSRCVLILCFALVYREGFPSRVIPVAGPDPFKGKAIVGAPRPGEKVFNVMQFGAKPDGKADNFQAFVAAWKATCSSREPARFLIPQGTFKVGPVPFAGPCQNQAPIIFEIIGTVKASTDPSEYTNGEWFLFESVNNIKIIGSGTFDGQGASVWKYNDCHTNSDCAQMPCSIKVNRATNVLLHGFTSLNAMGFHIFITNSVV
ncbi:putative Pectin lyase-like superfamily protein [Quillaja saponaria]|uniref:Pectin lyase-like superfamily protein n=1 Tax=Quillaja saponaria TaxID=32244 RepID=A0AAD7VLF7_QUISA|nr:putative Pectin lyase-like superfamily protein [Quillaja saponaria]